MRNLSLDSIKEYTRGYTQFERSFLGFGLLLFLMSGFLFLFEAERLGMWFGLLVESQQAPLGRLEFSQNSVKRKPLSSQNFVNLDSQQKVFDRDTILTADGAEAIFSLNDGGVLNLGPNTMVELIAKDPNPLDGSAPQLVLEIKKGEVTGSDGIKNLTIVKDGRRLALPKPKAGALLTKVEQKPRAELKLECDIKSQLVGIGQVSLSAICNGQNRKDAKISITDKDQKTIVKDQTLPTQITFALPGDYTVKWENIFADDETITVPSEWEGISFTNKTLACDGKLNWKYNQPTGKEPTQFTLDSPSLSQTEAPIESMQASAVALLKSFPSQVRVKSIPDANGFVWVSPVLKLSRAPDCNVLVHPADGSEIQAGTNVRTLFTWIQKLEQPEVKFELSNTENFSKILFSQKTMQNYVRTSVTKPGKYFWRVTDTKTGDHSLVSHFQKLK